MIDVIGPNDKALDDALEHMGEAYADIGFWIGGICIWLCLIALAAYYVI